MVKEVQNIQSVRSVMMTPNIPEVDLTRQFIKKEKGTPFGKAFQFGATGSGLGAVLPQGIEIINDEIYIQVITQAENIFGVSTGVGSGGYTFATAVLKFGIYFDLKWIKTFQSKNYYQEGSKITKIGDRLFFVNYDSSSPDVSTVKELSTSDGSTIASLTLSSNARGYSIASDGTDLWVVGYSSVSGNSNLWKIPTTLASDTRYTVSGSALCKSIKIGNATAYLADITNVVIYEVVLSSPTAIGSQFSDTNVPLRSTPSSSRLLVASSGGGNTRLRMLLSNNLASQQFLETTATEESSLYTGCSIYDGTDFYVQWCSSTQFNLYKLSDSGTYTKLGEKTKIPDNFTYLTSGMYADIAVNDKYVIATGGIIGDMEKDYDYCGQWETFVIVFLLSEI